MNRFSRTVAFVALAMLIVVLPLLAQTRAPQAPASESGIDLLLIEHTEAGAIERSGSVRYWRYVADSGTHAVLCVDYTPDGELILRDGFDVEVPSCQ